MAASTSAGNLSVVDGASSWTVAGGVSGGARLGQVSAVLADGDWLWAAGTDGMSVETPYGAGALR